jgi:hypothetical protein
MNDDIDPFNPPGFIPGGLVKFDITFNYYSLFSISGCFNKYRG